MFCISFKFKDIYLLATIIAFSDIYPALRLLFNDTY